MKQALLRSNLSEIKCVMKQQISDENPESFLSN